MRLASAASCMASHKPSSNSFAYKILGGDLTTEIRFELPSLRFETYPVRESAKCWASPR